jgi:DNA-binding transcriptional regulator YiaG
MDVSDTLQARFYSAHHGTMHQLRPSTIIGTAESFHRPVSQVIDVGSIGNVIRNSVTGATRAVPVDAAFATSAIQAVEMGDYNVDLWTRWAEAAKTALQRPAADAKPAPSAAARLRVERLATIQAVFGLSTLDFAQVLGLSRPGLYKWLDASKDVKLQGASRERLAVVERIARRWRERSAAPLVSVVNEPLAGGQTALSMMVADAIDEAAIVGAFDKLVAKLQGKSKSRSQKLADAGFTRRPSARALHADE